MAGIELVSSQADQDDYTTQPTHVRVFGDSDEWFVDGLDDEHRFTEVCWSFDSFEEAVASLPEFVERAVESGVTWNWNADRPRNGVRKGEQ